MEQEVDSGYRSVCSTCLSSDRNMISLSGLTQVYQIFQLLMFDFAADRFGDQLSKIEHLVCWECLALMRRFLRFKRQVHNAQEHLHMLAVSGSAESMDHTYMSQSLSALEMVSKVEYDKIYFDYVPDEPWPTTLITINQSDDVKNEQYDSVVQAVRDAVNLDIDHHIIEVPQIMIESPVTGVMSHLVIDRNNLISNDETYGHVKGELADLSGNIEIPKIENAITCSTEVKEVDDKKTGYITEYMTENDMLAFREQEQQKVKYATSNYKCELCIIGFYTQNQVKDHFLSAHRAQPNTEACKICYVYVPEAKLNSHVESHYIRHICRLCGHTETSVKFMKHHVRSHMVKVHSNAVIKIDGTEPTVKKKKKDTKSANGPHKPGDLRKLLSKTTIEGYQCLECDMFFKNSRARKNHVARFHREGLQCDHCKKRFVNRTTLATHLRLHEGPLPRDKCPICHKMVRVIQLKYHIKRHQNKSRYECSDCNKIFSHLATYQAHLKYSRAHASDQVFKFPCPMCNKGYPTKEAMQDHFNYQHLGKTSHKCPVCDKPIASRANVEKHMMRVHGEKKDKPRNHVCQQCGKAFTDRKALTQHEVIHSCDRPLSCDICQQTFKQKASLYTHRKRVHKVYPAKRVVEFMETKSEGT